MDEWKAKQERVNPNWKSGSRHAGDHAGTYAARNAADLLPVGGEYEILPGEAKPLSHKELHERYSAMLDKLVLEKWHREALLKDWAGDVNDVSDLLKKYPIRSLPPADVVRFSDRGRVVYYKNPPRKQLMAELYSRFGGKLAGTPGLYERNNDTWRAKPEPERWTIATRQGGILFPTFDKDGYIYRLRLKVDLPDLVIKEGRDAPYRGSYGYFTWQMAQDGLRCYFVPVGTKFEDRIEVPEKDAYGKARAKYVNFSSLLERDQDGVTINAWKNGSRSGSPYSLYGVDCVDESLVILTEGEKKAMVASRVCGVRAVSIPGVNNFNVIFQPEEDGESLYERLVATGAVNFLLCYDADKDTNESVQKCEQKFAEALVARNAKVFIGDWSSQYDKGLDDLLLLGLRPMAKPFRLGPKA